MEGEREKGEWGNEQERKMAKGKRRKDNEGVRENSDLGWSHGTVSIHTWHYHT